MILLSKTMLVGSAARIASLLSSACKDSDTGNRDSKDTESQQP